MYSRQQQPGQNQEHPTDIPTGTNYEHAAKTR